MLTLNNIEGHFSLFNLRFYPEPPLLTPKSNLTSSTLNKVLTDIHPSFILHRIEHSLYFQCKYDVGLP